MDPTFDTEAMLAEASQITGLADFGPDGFREGLAVYTDSLAGEARLSPLGTFALRSSVVSALANRLRVIDWATAHPEVEDAPIAAPVVVIGMFRAGTTLLSNLFDQDRSNRALLGWESSDSTPPPTLDDHRSGPRVDAARQARAGMDQLNPSVRAIHHEEVDGPTECIAVMSQDFKSLSWEAISNVPRYGAWLLATDQRSAYEYHRTVLQILQSGGVTGQWTLKSPHHAIALDALVSVYPDARLVLMHRDPVVLSASVCSLISTLSGTFTEADHTDYIAEHWTSVLDQSIRRVDSFRAAHPEHPVIDVQYSDLVDNPVRTMESLYSSLGIEFTGDAADAMASYVAAHPKGAHGSHGYNLETYGLNADVLAERFAGYIDRYDIAPE